MNSVDHEVLRQACAWLKAGRRVQLATVVRTFGSAPRPVGAMLAVDADGGWVGSVSGGCVEEDLVSRLRGRPSQLPERLCYGVSREQSQRFGLPCGGQLELIIEGCTDAGVLETILAALDRRRPICRRLHLADGRSTVRPADHADAVHVDGDWAEFVYGPGWRLIIIGAGQLSQYLARFALALDYRIIVCDPRPELWSGFERDGGSAAVETSREMPDDLIRALVPDPRTVIVALTHDPRLDDMALLEALGSPAFYVGALGSRLNNDKRRRRLSRHFGLGPAQLARLHGPVGLPIGSRSPPEIAIAILAELTALRNGATLVHDPAEPVADAGGCAALAR